MVVIKYARSYEDAIKKVNRATKKTVKDFKKSGKHIKKNSKQAKRIRKNLKEYWSDKIYDTFNARSLSGKPNSGQLGKSLVVQIRNSEIAWYMKRIGHPEGGGISGGECYDYGRLLRQERTNFPQRPINGSSMISRYRSDWDCKVYSRIGQNELSYNKYWGKWEKIWEEYFIKLCDEEMSEYFNSLIKKDLERYL